MQALRATAAGAPPVAAGRRLNASTARRSCVRVAAQQGPPREGASSSRRALLAAALAAASAAAGTATAQATDYKEALAKKEARKARLKAAAGTMKTTGADQQVFNKSDYSLPEEARTPNMHSRQNEGARTQENV